MYTTKAPVHYASFTKERRLKVYKGKDISGRSIEIFPDGIEGVVKSISQFEYEYDNKKDWAWKITFSHEDNGEVVTCVLKMHKCGGPTRSLLNSLCSADMMKKIELEYWVRDEKYIRIGLKQDGFVLSWKYGPEEMPKAETITTPSGKTFKDDSKVEQWCIDRVTEINRNMGINVEKPHISTPSPQEQAFEDIIAPKEDEEEVLDLPF